MPELILSLVSMCGDPTLRAELEELSEALRYSDPVSRDELKKIGFELSQLISVATMEAGTPA